MDVFHPCIARACTCIILYIFEYVCYEAEKKNNETENTAYMRNYNEKLMEIGVINMNNEHIRHEMIRELVHTDS